MGQLLGDISSAGLMRPNQDPKEEIVIEGENLGNEFDFRTNKNLSNEAIQLIEKKVVIREFGPF